MDIHVHVSKHCIWPWHLRANSIFMLSLRNRMFWKDYVMSTHWGRVTHICVGKTTIIGSDNGLSPGRRQAIIWTNAGILLTGPLGTNFSGILIEILTFSFTKMRLKVSSAKWRPFCFGLDVLIWSSSRIMTTETEHIQDKLYRNVRLPNQGSRNNIRPINDNWVGF